MPTLQSRYKVAIRKSLLQMTCRAKGILQVRWDAVSAIKAVLEVLLDLGS